jgi:hypothetical protein
VVSAADRRLQRSVSRALQRELSSAARVVQVLERFGVGVGLQVATTLHPSFPALRLSLDAAPLRIHLSPWRYQRIASVLRALKAPEQSGGGAAPGGAAAATAPAAAAKPLWLSEAEFSAHAWVLSWEGLGGTVATWRPRWVHVWRGRVYLTAERDDVEPLATRSYWQSHRVLTVPLQRADGGSAGGGSGSGGGGSDRNSGGGAAAEGERVDSALAIAPASVKRELAAEHPDALVLRCGSTAKAAALRRFLQQSAHQMQAVAGALEARPLPIFCPPLSCPPRTPFASRAPAAGGAPMHPLHPQPSPQPSLTSVKQEAKLDDGAVGTTADVLDEALKHQVLVSVSGRLREARFLFSLNCCGSRALARSPAQPAAGCCHRRGCRHCPPAVQGPPADRPASSRLNTASKAGQHPHQWPRAAALVAGAARRAALGLALPRARAGAGCRRGGDLPAAQPRGRGIEARGRQILRHLDDALGGG